MEGSGEGIAGSGPAEPVRLLRPWPDQFLRLSKIFRAATCSCRLEICVLVACKLSAGDARLIGASLSELHTSELAGGFSICMVRT